MRTWGKLDKMIKQMVIELNHGGTVSLANCNDPQPFLDRLTEHGVTAVAEPMVATQMHRLVYDKQGEPVGISFGSKIQTGYRFINSNMQK